MLSDITTLWQKKKRVQPQTVELLNNLVKTRKHAHIMKGDDRTDRSAAK